MCTAVIWQTYLDCFYPGLLYPGLGLGRDRGITRWEREGRGGGSKECSKRLPLLKWLFVGLNLPWDLGLGIFLMERDGWVEGWMDGWMGEEGAQ